MVVEKGLKILQKIKKESSSTFIPGQKKETEEQKKEREKQEQEILEGKRGKLVAVVEKKRGDEIKEGVIFIHYNGAYELYGYDGILSASGSPGDHKTEMKILHVIYDADLEKKAKEKPEKPDIEYDLEILDD